MADKKIELTKKIISHRKSNNIYSKSFNDLQKSSRILDDDKIEEIYNNLFYKIPKEGKNSHEYIIIQSKDYLYPGINKRLEDKIDTLVNRIEGLQKELNDLRKPPPEHPDYPNGSMLTAGTFDGGQYQAMQTVYYMQEGKKRAFASAELYYIVRKAEKYPGENWSELIFLSVNDLNAIPDGKKITSNSSLSSKNIDADYGDIYQRLPYYTLDLYCEGREANDTLDLVNGDFWLDTDEDDACTVRYIKNSFDGDEHLGESYKWSVETQTIGVGKTKTIKFAKDDDVQNLQGIPSEFTEDDYNAEYNYALDVQQTGVRHWGKDARFKGIVYAEGRLTITEGGDAFNTKQHGPISTGLTFDEVMPSGVRKIYSSCRQPDGVYEDPCYGDLNQWGSTLRNAFDDPTFEYYKKTIRFDFFKISSDTGLSNTTILKLKNATSNFALYGQPILRKNEKFYVYLTSKKYWLIDDMEDYIKHDYHIFYDLLNKKVTAFHDMDMEDYFFNKDFHPFKVHKAVVEASAAVAEANNSSIVYPHGNLGTDTDNYFNWEYIDSSRVAYVGLVGYNTKGTPSNSGNYFNPTDEGSNFELTPGAQDILNLQS